MGRCVHQWENNVTVGRQFWTEINPVAQWTVNMAASPMKNVSFTCFSHSSLHYLTHSREGLIIQSDHQWKEPLSFPACSKKPRVLLNAPIIQSAFIPSFSGLVTFPRNSSRFHHLHVMSSTAWSRVLPWLSTLPTGGLTTTLYPLPASKCFTHGKQS